MVLCRLGQLTIDYFRFDSYDSCMRTKAIQVRLSEEEYQTMQKVADYAGLSVSAWLRVTALVEARKAYQHVQNAERRNGTFIPPRPAQ